MLHTFSDLPGFKIHVLHHNDLSKDNTEKTPGIAYVPIQVTNSHHRVLIGRRKVLLKFALRWHLDQVDGVDVQRIIGAVVSPRKL